MTDTWVQFLIQTASMIAAILVSVGTLRQRDQTRAATLAVIKADIEHIKERVDAIDTMRERLSDVESSTKSAHKRLDEHIQYEYAERRKSV